MVYCNDFKGEKLSALGFGTLRLPLIEGTKEINEAAVSEMVEYAIRSGVNYFDLAYTYHDGKSESAMGKCLSMYPRESFFLADKFPGYQVSDSYPCEKIFSDQLKKCGVDYFDYYLFHNVNNASLKTYLDPRWKIPEYFIEMKKQGKIRHLGFSCHGDLDCINTFLDRYGSEMEFCQIQMNYLDWTIQFAKEKYELLTERGLGVWVMEPCRGGKLAKLKDSFEERMKEMRPDETVPAWAFRFLQELPNVKVILSGMSSMEQVKDNVRTFSDRRALTEEEKSFILTVADEIKNAVPCTGCSYCCDGCPMHINIPKLIALYNDYQVYPSSNINMSLSAIPKDRLPSACIGCGQCEAVCPQGIKVPEVMKNIDKVFSVLPTWEEICRKKSETQKKEKTD